VKVDPHANERQGAFRVGNRDELVTAVGLAVNEKLPAWTWKFSREGPRAGSLEQD
jgi:hypothetical protein